MKLIFLLLDAFVFTLVLAESRTNVQDDKIRPSLVHLFRAKRFDFSMFGCSFCMPVMECTSDHTCVYKKGHGYTCEFRCCTFVCVKRSSGHRTASLSHDSFKDDTGDDQVEDTQDVSVDVSEDEDANNKQNLSNTFGETEGLPISTESTNRKLGLDGDNR